MWLSEKRNKKDFLHTHGMVSIGGDNCAVVSFGETRGAYLYAPGGYIWKPAPGDDVLVFKNDGVDIAGKLCESSDISPGEVCIRSAGGAEIYLCNDGNVYIRGKLVTEGEK